MRVIIFVPPQVHLLEIAGVRDALFEANERMDLGACYEVQVVAEAAGPMATASGQCFLPDATIADADALGRLPHADAVVPIIQGNGDIQAEGR